ncbi:MAG: calcium-binding protein [Sphingobium sp.]
MKRYRILGAAALVAVAAPLVVYAQMDQDKPIKRADVSAMVKEKFAKADANKDGVITIDEMKSARDAKASEWRVHRFDKIDGNKDGMISRAEFDAAHMGGDGPGHDMADKPDHDGDGPGMEMDHGGMGHRPGMGRGMGGKMGAMFFARADSNHDGKLTLAEANSAALMIFDKVDTNKDAVVTPAEKQAFHEKMRAMMAAGKGRGEAAKQ